MANAPRPARELAPHAMEVVHQVARVAARAAAVVAMAAAATVVEAGMGMGVEATGVEVAVVTLAVYQAAKAAHSTT